LVQVSNSVLINQTIDDGLGDLQNGLKIRYSLKNGSELVWKSQDIFDDTCFVNIDPTKARNNTWSSATCSDSEIASAKFSFHGTAIYIYFITAASSCLLPSGSIATTDCEFRVDGQVVGNYAQTPTSDVFEYNTLVYANNSLSDALHTFAIRAKRNSFLIFDYAQYTFVHSPVSWSLFF
ncbi:hypothetical protein BD779DRAFT_1628895, partial [Infundibulicybe gibba]